MLKRNKMEINTHTHTYISISVIPACPSMYILVIISLIFCTSGSFFKYILLKMLWFIKIWMWFSSGIFYAVCEICPLADTSHKTLLRKTCLDFTSKLHQLLKAKLAKLMSAAQQLLVFTYFFRNHEQKCYCFIYAQQPTYSKSCEIISVQYSCLEQAKSLIWNRKVIFHCYNLRVEAHRKLSSTEIIVK